MRMALHCFFYGFRPVASAISFHRAEMHQPALHSWPRLTSGVVNWALSALLWQPTRRLARPPGTVR
jgi:hypothetical protein